MLRGLEVDSAMCLEDLILGLRKVLSETWRVIVDESLKGMSVVLS